MKKNILFGNGINIQFGGMDKCSNSAIIRRMLHNIDSGRYDMIVPGVSKEEIKEVINGLADIVRHIEKWIRYGDGLFMLLEIKRIKNSYNPSTDITDIGFEDLFIALELLSNKEKDSGEFRQMLHRELQMLFLDAIFNDGEINQIDYTEKMKDLLETYENVFTLNYDTSLDRYYPNVKHLHGRFDVLAPEYDATSEFVANNPDEDRSGMVASGYEYLYSNTIMSWYWLEKYGEWLNKEDIFGADDFKNMEGELHIVGMSPCNDEHLFIMINLSKVKNIVYYYRTDKDRIEMAKKIKKPITYINVDKFWQKLEM